MSIEVKDVARKLREYAQQAYDGMRAAVAADLREAASILETTSSAAESDRKNFVAMWDGEREAREAAESRATAAEGRVALLEEERDDEDWRDMSTAPRDGTHILVRFGRADDVTPPTVAHWFGTPEDGSWYLSVQQHEGPPICPAFWRLIPAFCEGGQ